MLISANRNRTNLTHSTNPINPASYYTKKVIFQCLKKGEYKELAIAFQDKHFEDLNLCWMPECKYKIDAKGLETLYQALKNNTIVTRLRLYGNNIGDDSVPIITRILRENSTLTWLDLGDTYIKDDGVEALMKSLENNTTLTYLDLSGNSFGVRGAKAILKALESNTTLTEVLIYGNTTLHDRVQPFINKISKRISFNRKPKTPVLQNVLKLREQDTIDTGAILKLLEAGSQINLLDIDLWFPTDALKKSGYTGNDFVNGIGNALVSNTSLTTLSLRGILMDESGLMGMCKGLAFNRTLSTLALIGSPFGATGAAMLGMSLSLNQGIRLLNLSNNGVGRDGVSALCAALRTNGTLTALLLTRNHIGDQGACKLADALKSNKTLILLDLEYNEIGYVGIKAMANSLLSSNKTLGSLDLSHNFGFQGEIVQTIEECIRQNKENLLNQY